jgi:lipopolysaccharide export system permease protein
MRLLDRYLLRELMAPLGYCLSGFWIFWVSFDLISELSGYQRLGLKTADILHYYLLRTPDMLGIVLPVALLLAQLYALTNHARHHELTAIRAAGVSLARLVLPYVGVGVALSLGMLALNELWGPRCADGAEQLLHRPAGQAANPAARREPTLVFTDLRGARKWDVEEFDLVTGEMLAPHVTWALPDGSRQEIFGSRAMHEDGRWVFTNVEVFVYPPAQGAVPTRVETNRLVIADATKTPEQVRSEIKVNKITSLRSARKTQLSLREILDYQRLHPEETGKRALLETKLHGRLAAPWTCLVVVLIALPFGAAGGRRNVFVGVATSILICFAYFVLQQVALAVGVGGFVPAWLAGWGPNALFAACGLGLTWRLR